MNRRNEFARQLREVLTHTAEDCLSPERVVAVTLVVGQHRPLRVKLELQPDHRDGNLRPSTSPTAQLQRRHALRICREACSRKHRLGRLGGGELLAKLILELRIDAPPRPPAAVGSADPPPMSENVRVRSTPCVATRWSFSPFNDCPKALRQQQTGYVAPYLNNLTQIRGRTDNRAITGNPGRWPGTNMSLGTIWVKSGRE